MRLWVCCLVLGLAACAHRAPGVAQQGSTDTRTWTAQDIAGWQQVQLPGKNPTQYVLQLRDGRAAVHARAESAVSFLRQPLRIPAQELGVLEFAWQVPALLPGADVGQRHSDDSPARMVLVFDGDRSSFSAQNAMLSELSQALTGEPLPYATLMYVWCNQRPVGTVVHNPRTDRIRKIVVASGPQQLNQWLHLRRDIRADFERAFGEAPGTLLGVGVMTDSDNTRSAAQAWYGEIALR